MPKFGSFIRSLRTEKGMTQAALGEKLHVTDKAVSKWERGLSYPDISLFPKLADLLGVTVSDLLREGDDGKAPSRLIRYYQMSRDIRTPIHIIMGCTDLVERYADDAQKRQRYLESIRVSAQFLLERCEQISKAANLDDKMTAEDLSAYFLRQPDKPELPVYEFKGKRILVAEDMELNREIARGLIEQTGAEAAFAEDGAECLRMIEEAPAGTYDLILMDLSMPNMSGIEATGRIRQLEEKEKATIPIIAMTANVDEKDREAAYAAGMDAFAAKPVELEKLYAMMEEFL